MKNSYSKIFIILLLCSVAFAGGIEDDTGPEEVSEKLSNDTQWHEENFPLLLEKIIEVANLKYVLF